MFWGPKAWLGKVPVACPTGRTGLHPGIFDATPLTRYLMIPKPTSTAVATRYSWGTGCEGWHLLRMAGLSIIEERMPPGTREVRHWHARATQFFYVLAGTLTLEVEGVNHHIGPRTGIELPQGTAHQAINDSDAPVEFLVVSTPPAQGDRIEAEKAWLGSLLT